MKAIAAIQVDLRTPPLGTSIRPDRPLAGVPILRRTIERLRRSRKIASIHVLSSLDQRDEVAALVQGLPVVVEAHAGGRPMWHNRVRHARKWALDAWRGGVGGLCWWDEDLHAGALAALGRREAADAVASVPAAAAVIDPLLIDGMIDHFDRLAEDTRMVFSQAPPGLAPFLARPDILEDLHQAGQPAGALLTYMPDNPQMDLTTRPCCYVVSNLMVTTPVRLLADTQRSVSLLTELLTAKQADQLDAEGICRFVTDRWAGRPESLPRETEIELTTDDQLPETKLRPRGRRVPRRGPLVLETARSLAAELGHCDDSLVVLGGFGEPLLHPDLSGVLDALRESRVFGIAVRTNGIGLNEKTIDILIDHDVVVLNVTIDTHSVATYRALNGADHFEQVTANIQAALARCAERKSAGPLIVPEMAKIRATMPEQEAFFDHWIRKAGWANIIGPPHCAQQIPEVEGPRIAPPHRSSCSRLWSRVVVLADGVVVTCDQDFAARQVIGRIPDDSLAAIWNGEPINHIRNAHRSDRLENLALCPHCDEWHRP